MAEHGDPATAELARRSKAYWARLRGYLAGRPAVQLKDFAIEAGLSDNHYGDHVYTQAHHAEKLLDIGYRPVIVPAMSGAISVLIFVREPWPLDAHAGAVHSRLLPYLEDGDPLMALLVYRAQRDSMPRELH